MAFGDGIFQLKQGLSLYVDGHVILLRGETSFCQLVGVWCFGSRRDLFVGIDDEPVEGDGCRNRAAVYFDRKALKLALCRNVESSACGLRSRGNEDLGIGF